jgi:hypothetical protein
VDVVIAAEPSWVQVPIAVVLVVLVFYVLPYVVIPAVARWRTRRRGGAQAESPSGWTAVIIAAILAAFVVAISWDSDLGRPALGALLVATLAVIGGMWWASRRKR